MAAPACPAATPSTAARGSGAARARARGPAGQGRRG
eukprot:CAMPEP_0182907654 /NCGR_PEP_ID=MMETSP0034_2-20130328/34645_1 /TAXON_ID=156128 /ORGANISM="Nephroselmis pyriformis, Strain CCMP717" /LENGTH=35 /DNA_ID= /DNA_START= /DNA_END= /DNA_ORIENTATION=